MGCGRMNVTKDGWVLCPICGKGKLLLTKRETVIRHLECKCKRCGQVSELNIEAPEPASDETSA